MSKKKILLSVLLIAAAAIGVFTVYTSKNKLETVYLSASWMQGYADIPDLSRNSDLIALVHVNKLEDCKEGSLPKSIFEVEVMEPVYGCEKGDLIHITMTGGIVGNQKIEIKHDPLLERGQEFLVFTRKNEDDTYTILGGPQGRLVYDNGTLNALHNAGGSFARSGTEGSAVALSVDVKDEDAETVIKEIKALME